MFAQGVATKVCRSVFYEPYRLCRLHLIIAQVVNAYSGVTHIASRRMK
ncbi:hypothetical protein ALQ36_101551 [Pseudomonas syringae pv. primulae]|uniref:Uncharacterized protein n=1 Tax=Pseudomonas syringae pv. primulae TaxID=251707 RepID=A0A3M5TGU4_9PSED|nr:hypothetical protein ALQ36_101551 [Pseudomonas syringae pv. primulae]RMR11883.1 hypothetical protein ALP92_101641 [Pseudomonas syringae pv. primulae]RMU32147.1 hypothetical protein ALP30_101704 [Pseudomonas syringae pv. primulae]